MNSYKKLISNSFVFAVGRLGSKVLSFLLVPLYTYYLSTAEYGTVDLVITTVNMLLPLVSASMFNAVLRFVIENKKEADIVLSNALTVTTIGFIISLLFYKPLTNLNFFSSNEVITFMYILLFVQMLEGIFSEFTRAIGEVKKFALNGILITFTTASLNIIFLVAFDWGVFGYFLSLILANIISIIYLLISTKIYSIIKISKAEINGIKRMLFYALPLIPNSLMWWLINASSRYFINYYSGVDANGIFAVASKIPSLITIVNQIFTQAWQLSAIEEFDKVNKSKFYSNVFRYLVSFMFIGASAIIVVVKPMFDFLFSPQYYFAWKIVPFLLLGSIFSSFSGFLGTNYLAAKQTKGVFTTSVYGGVVSLVLNIVLISKFGIIGAGISSMVSFFVIWILRLVDTKKFIVMDVYWNELITYLIIIFMQVIVLHLPFNNNFELFVEVLLFILLINVNKNIYKLIGFFKRFKK